ncbi:MAG: 30S ribosome-binding factor RbfA [Bacteroidota bacterium]
MESLRQNKVSRLLQKEVADIFQKEMRNVFGSGLITVTHVFVSSDLSYAKIYLSLYGVKEKEKMLKAIKNHAREIRKRLGNRIGKQVRIIPELVFFVDESADYAEKIEELFKNIS